MSRYLMSIRGDFDKRKAINFIMKAPAGTRLEFRGPKRNLDQNAKLWAMLSELAEQLPWHGVKLKADDWKLVFMDALKREMRTVPNIEGNGFVNLGRSSSELSKQEFSDLLELINAFAAKHGVTFNEPGSASSVSAAGGEERSSRPSSPASQSKGEMA